MATNKVFKETEGRNRERLLAEVTQPTTPPTSILPGVPVRFADGSAVSLTASPNATRTETLTGTGVSVTYPIGGVGNQAGAASFAFDGTWEFAVTGATTSTASGVTVYITNAGALTLTSTSATAYGVTDYPRDYFKSAGIAPVRIGD